MDSTGLYDAFRTDVVDTARPYAWSEDEVWRYAADAQRMFIRQTGGVADATSLATAIDVTTGEAWSDLHPSILRIMSMTRRSDGRLLKILNNTDLEMPSSSDYGQSLVARLDMRAGPVHSAVIGLERNKVRWLQIPEADDTVDAYIYRLPLKVISGPDQEITDIPEEHHLHLLDWMKALAYRKQDLDTFDPNKAADCESRFLAYCLVVKAEWSRYMHKTRVVTYGGL